jgi:hypothetical protein
VVSSTMCTALFMMMQHKKLQLPVTGNKLNYISIFDIDVEIYVLFHALILFLHVTSGL